MRSETNTQRTPRRCIPKHGTPEGNAGRILLIAFDVLRHQREYVELDDLKELIKTACARFHLAYDSAVVGRAAEIALMRKGKGTLR